jgi:hypothetical protein
MKEQIRILQAEIMADLQAIAEAYQKLNTANQDISQDKTDIAIGYYLNVIYGLFENLFMRIATLFGNQIKDKSQWHSQLLHRMTLNVEEVRPRVISDETYQCLNELRRFRHIFRNAYLLEFDNQRLTLVFDKAQQLEQLYQIDLNIFLSFLVNLVKGECA